MAGMYPDNETISLFGEEVSWPGVDEETGKFTNGDFSNPMRKPSFIPAETVNLILDNLSGLIASLGGEPNNNDAAQLENAIADALALKADVNNPAFTGTPTVPAKSGAIAAAASPSAAQNTAIATEGQIAATRNAINGDRAPIASPTFTGTPDVPAASAAVAAAATPTAAQSTRIATVGQIAATRNAINGDRMPVGTYYTQYPVVSATTHAAMFPANRTPAQLFGGTWTERFQGEEVFFRTTGGNADTSGSQLGERRGQRWDGTAWAAGGATGIEPDMIRNVSDRFELHNSGAAAFVRKGFGLFVSDTDTSLASHGQAGFQSAFGMSMDISRQVPTGAVNTPRNRLIRVWERTA
ncbi:MAG: hypothetical protein FWB99_08470 [Treponema sp.]|nr:hypothetical protein [Treponema sp.]